jgi:NAD dependent epimerase/dehydratase
VDLFVRTSPLAAECNLGDGYREPFCTVGLIDPKRRRVHIFSILIDFSDTTTDFGTNMTNSPQILVTGGDGFIGSHLVEHLLENHLNVRAMVQYNSLNSWGWLEQCPDQLRSNLEVVVGDIRDPHFTRQAMTGCDRVFHLAALIAIPYSYRAPGSYVDTNVHGTLNLLQAASDAGVSRFVHTSTSEVYGTAQFVPITEEHPLNAQSPYAATKIAADQLALSFFKSFGLPVSIVRPFNTFGPRQSARAVIPTIITQLLSGQQTIELGTLQPTRDFNYVLDIVRGFLAVANSRETVGEVVNLGSNFEISIGETANLIAKVMGKTLEIVTDENRLRPSASEVDRLWADNSKARDFAGWEPNFGGISGFRNGLEKTVQWFEDSNNMSKYKSEIYNV